MRYYRLKSVSVLSVICGSLLTAQATAANPAIHDGMQKIDQGELKSAKTIFEKVVTDNNTSLQDRAIALKHLGTVKNRLGENAIPEYDRSCAEFQKALKTNSSSELKQEFGRLLFQRANARLSLYEQELHNMRNNSGKTAFAMMQSYIFPVKKDLQEARNFCAKSMLPDIELAECETSLAEARLWTAVGQNASAERSYKMTIKKINILLQNKEMLKDTHKKALLRKVAVLEESSNGNVKSVWPEMLQSLKAAAAIDSKNVELDQAAIVYFAKSVLKYSADYKADFPDMKEVLQKEIAATESRRTSNIGSSDFESKKRYFASRTAVYEAMLGLYAKQNDIPNMLCTIESMKNRALQEFTGGKTLLQAKDIPLIQQFLKQKNGMLVSYFLGAGDVWIITVTPTELKVRKADGNGTEINAMVQRVIKGCEQPAGRRTVPFAEKAECMKISSELFQKLLAPEYKMFCDAKYATIFIAPQGHLNNYPFRAFVTKLNTEDYELSTFLAEDNFPVVYVSALKNIAGVKEIRMTGDCILFARGDFTYPANRNGDYVNSPLTGTIPEVKGVQKILNVPDSQVFIEKKATEETLVNYFKDKPVILVHAATHGDLNAANPLNSFLLLAQGGQEDGALKVTELLTRYAEKFPCRLFVLSACNTNRGEENLLPGDDIAALSAGIAVAGADNVIATNWEASDATFPVIMNSFYKEANWKVNPAGAMAQAIKQFLKKGEYRDPFFWANIAIMGRN